MILPGLSGSYLLLLMGQYVPILGAIGQFKDAISERDFAMAMDPAISVMLPVGIGVVVGVVVVGNLLEWLLRRFRKETLGILLGLLIGSTVGLWPFKVGEPPKVGDVIKAQVVTVETINEIEPDDWLTKNFQPTGQQIGTSVFLVILGFGATMAVTMLGGKEPDA